MVLTLNVTPMEGLLVDAPPWTEISAGGLAG